MNSPQRSRYAGTAIAKPHRRWLTDKPRPETSRRIGHAKTRRTMKATVMYKAGDVRVENVPDAAIEEPTDAVIRVVRSCICGSDLWPYKDMEPKEGGARMGHEALGVVEDVGSEVSRVKKGDL